MIPLIDRLAALYPQNSKNSLRSWIQAGRVTVDGKVVRLGNHPVEDGQKIVLGDKTTYIKGDLTLLYEDRDLVVVDKPTGLLSVATNFEKGENVHAYLKDKYAPKRVYVVHRLDQDTSGVMLFALSEKARDQLKDMFEKHDFDRQYVALVEGHLEEKSGTWKCLLWEDENYRVHVTKDPTKGKEAITHFQVEGESKRFTRLRLKLETGKKNQIRVHCSQAKHPILGDKKYGAELNPMKRVCLHANILAFKHPTTGKMMRFESPVPEAFLKVVP